MIIKLKVLRKKSNKCSRSKTTCCNYIDYIVLQNVVHCSTLYYICTTLYHICTTFVPYMYYICTTYVLHMYYNVLQCTTMYYNVLQNVVQCTTYVVM